MSDKIVLADSKPDGTDLDWRVEDHTDDPIAVNTEVWTSLRPGAYGVVTKMNRALGGRVTWVVYDRTGLMLDSGIDMLSSVTAARVKVESLLSERDAT